MLDKWPLCPIDGGLGRCPWGIILERRRAKALVRGFLCWYWCSCLVNRRAFTASHSSSGNFFNNLISLIIASQMEDKLLLWRSRRIIPFWRFVSTSLKLRNVRQGMWGFPQRFAHSSTSSSSLIHRARSFQTNSLSLLTSSSNSTKPSWKDWIENLLDEPWYESMLATLLIYTIFSPPFHFVSHRASILN